MPSDRNAYTPHARPAHRRRTLKPSTVPSSAPAEVCKKAHEPLTSVAGARVKLYRPPGSRGTRGNGRAGRRPKRVPAYPTGPPVCSAPAVVASTPTAASAAPMRPTAPAWRAVVKYDEVEDVETESAQKLSLPAPATAAVAAAWPVVGNARFEVELEDGATRDSGARLIDEPPQAACLTPNCLTCAEANAQRRTPGRFCYWCRTHTHVTSDCDSVRCTGCGEKGHTAVTCRTKPDLAFDIAAYRCVRCLEPGHLSSECLRVHAYRASRQRQARDATDGTPVCFFCDGVGHEQAKCPTRAICNYLEWRDDVVLLPLPHGPRASVGAPPRFCALQRICDHLERRDGNDLGPLIQRSRTTVGV